MCLVTFFSPFSFCVGSRDGNCIVSANLFPLIFRILAVMVTWRWIFSKMASIQSLCCISEHLSMVTGLENVMLFYLHSHLSIITVCSLLPSTFFCFAFLCKKNIRKITFESLCYYNSLASQFGIFLIL